MGTNKYIGRQFLCNFSKNYFVEEFLLDGERAVFLCSNDSDRFFHVRLDDEEQNKLHAVLSPRYDGDSLFDALKNVCEYNRSEALENPHCIVKIWIDALKSAEVDFGIMKIDPHFRKLMNLPVFFYEHDSNPSGRLFFDILMNAVEQYQIGVCSSIRIKYFSPIEFSIEDDGEGIPLGYDSVVKTELWRIIFDYKPGTKFDRKREEQVFYSKIPTFSCKYSEPMKVGVIVGSLSFLSSACEFLKIDSVRENEATTLYLDHGVSEEGLQKTNSISKGTRIRWKFDECYLKEPCVPFEKILYFAQTEAMLNPGLKINVANAETGGEYYFCYPNGCAGYLEDKLTGIPHSEIQAMSKNFEEQIQRNNACIMQQKCLSVVVSLSESSFCEVYHNYRKMIWGDTNGAIDKAIQKVSQRLAINADEIKKHLSVVVATNSEYTQWFNETYVCVQDAVFASLIEDFISDAVEKAANALYTYLN